MEARTPSIKERFEGVTAGLVTWLVERGVTATQVSIGGLAITFIGAAMLANGDFWFGPWVFAVGSTTDAIDGALARRTGTVSDWGGFIDSTFDRIGEASGIMAVAVWFAMHEQTMGVALSVAALLGGNLTSYVRARAEVLGIECSEGWFGRPGRVTIFCLFLFLQLPMLMIWLLAIASCVTAAQRIHIVYRALAERRAAVTRGDREETRS